MSGYISEYRYYGLSDVEFIEVAVPSGTDVSSYSVSIYSFDGSIVITYPLGTLQGTYGGQDVYVIDSSTPGFTMTAGEGEIYADDALALVDGSGAVLQFISHWGNTVTATEGPANGMTSVEVGTASGTGQSLQSDDGGSTYYTQSSPNKGTVPACYGRGTRILTTQGYVAVEKLTVGTLIATVDQGIQPIRLIWSDLEPIDDIERHQKPVRISKDAFAPGLPSADLIVSGQHRIAVGFPDQLDEVFSERAFVPAKALVGLPGISHWSEAQTVRWYHFACAQHCIVKANELASETLLLGPRLVGQLSGPHVRAASQDQRQVTKIEKTQATALPTLTKRQAQEILGASTGKPSKLSKPVQSRLQPPLPTWLHGVSNTRSQKLKTRLGCSSPAL